MGFEVVRCNVLLGFGHWWELVGMGENGREGSEGVSLVYLSLISFSQEDGGRRLYKGLG